MNKSFTDALHIITGDKGGGYYLAGLFFSVLAILLSIYTHTKTRDKTSMNTPFRFSILFMLWDNAKRALAGLVVMFFIFRIFDCSNVIVMIGVGFFVSFGIDKAIQLLMDYTNIANILKTDRSNSPVKP